MNIVKASTKFLVFCVAFISFGVRANSGPENEWLPPHTNSDDDLSAMVVGSSNSSHIFNQPMQMTEVDPSSNDWQNITLGQIYNGCEQCVITGKDKVCDIIQHVKNANCVQNVTENWNLCNQFWCDRPCKQVCPDIHKIVASCSAKGLSVYGCQQWYEHVFLKCFDECSKKGSSEGDLYLPGGSALGGIVLCFAGTIVGAIACAPVVLAALNVKVCKDMDCEALKHFIEFKKNKKQ